MKREKDEQAELQLLLRSRFPILVVETAEEARFLKLVLPQLDGVELAIAPLLVPDPEHGIPDAVWSRLHAYFAA